MVINTFPASVRPLLPPGAVGEEWLTQLKLKRTQSPEELRKPLCWQGARIGSVAEAIIHHAALSGLWRVTDEGVVLPTGADLTQSLAPVALALRDAGLMKAWRNEQLAVHEEQGALLGTVERGAVRLLGIATEAVHLAGWHPDGRFWVQQRAFTKPTDPGLWDTLVGGMVPAGEPLATALARETWEEAGLVLADLQDLAYGGCITTERPANELAHGHVVERLHWYTAVVPDGVVPVNQDGEVAQFACMAADEVAKHLLADGFALDAALILLAACDAG